MNTFCLKHKVVRAALEPTQTNKHFYPAKNLYLIKMKPIRSAGSGAMGELLLPVCVFIVGFIPF